MNDSVSVKQIMRSHLHKNIGYGIVLLEILSITLVYKSGATPLFRVV